MSVIRNVFFMGSSTGVRLLFGTLTFPLMARLLGANQFGIVMLWLSVSTLLAMVSSFGLSTYILREMGAAQDRAAKVMCDALAAKIVLSLLVVLIDGVMLLFLQPTNRWVFGLLSMAMLLDSMTEFLNVGFRATNRFSAETRVASIAAVSQFAIIGAALYWRATPISAALGFLLSRLFVVFLTWQAQRRYFAQLRPGSLRDALACIRLCLAYGVDYGLQGLFGQVDSVLLNHFAGPAAVGLYQAGMKVFLGGAQAATVLANVFLPRAAAANGDPAQFRRESRLVQRVFIGFGAAFGLILAVFPGWISAVLYGHAFAALRSLLPWFGLLFFVRFFAASWGVILTSAGQQSFRAWANVALWVVQLSLAAWWIPRFGAVGWLMALVCGHLFLSVVYLARGIRSTPLCLRTLSMTALGAAAFLPFVSLPQLGGVS